MKNSVITMKPDFLKLTNAFRLTAGIFLLIMAAVSFIGIFYNPFHLVSTAAYAFFAWVTLKKGSAL